MPAYDHAAPPDAPEPNSPEEDLHVETLAAPDHAVVTITGSLHVETLAPAEDALKRAFWDNQVVIADLEHVTFCDSSGLNLLLQVRADALAAGAELRLAAVSQPVRRVLELTGADAAFDVHPTVRAALAHTA